MSHALVLPMNDSAISRSELAAFLQTVDSSFRPTLSSRIQFQSFAEKVLSRGIVLKATDSGRVIGVAIFYANDDIGKTAYLSVVAVHDSHRQHGVGKQLVMNAIDISRSSGMRRVLVQTNPDNAGAVALYRSLGFHVCEKPQGEHVREKSIFMELLL